MNRLSASHIATPIWSQEGREKNKWYTSWLIVLAMHPSRKSLTLLFFQLFFLIASHFLADCINMYAHVNAFVRLPAAAILSWNIQLGKMPDLQNRMDVNNREMKRRKPVCRNPPLESMRFVLRIMRHSKRKITNH